MENSSQPTEIIQTTTEEAGIEANGADEVHVTEVVEESKETKAEGETPKAEEENKVEQKVEGEQDKRFASKFAALSRKDKLIKQREKELADRERRIKELEEKLQAPKEPKKEEAQQEESLELMMRKDVLGTLQNKFGITLDHLVNIALNNGKITPEMENQLKIDEYNRKMEQKLKEFEEKLTKKEQEELKRQEEIKAQQEKEAIEEFKTQIKSYVTTNVDKYELINSEEAEDLVFDVIEEHYKASGKILDIKDAAEEVENYLLEEARKLMKLKKLSQSQKEDLKDLSKDEPKQEKKASVTLSNSQSQVQSNGSGGRLLTRDESLAEAAKLLRWREE